ncbi:MAG: hypothetical protein WCS73_06525 [Lentisphaeria bacterium]
MFKWAKDNAKRPGILKDYAFLSTPDSDAVFIVERNGIIWQQYDEVMWSVEERKRSQLLNWTDYLNVNANWSWLDGYLPVLQIKHQAKLMNVFSFSGELYIDLGDSAFEVKSMRKISQVEIAEKIGSIRKYWQQRLSNLSFDDVNCKWLNNALKTSFVLAESTYHGLHPHYGSGFYGLQEHDGFPPTTIRVVENYIMWGEVDRAGKILKYFLENFIDKTTGKIKYYGPSLAEYGMLLELITLFDKTNIGRKWLTANIAKSQKIVKAMLKLLNKTETIDKTSGLLIGIPEADEAKDIGIFIHNNAYFAVGLEKWGLVASNYELESIAAEANNVGRKLKMLTRSAIDKFKAQYGFVPYRLDGATTKPERFFESRNSGYANYRYYPELLESGILTQDEIEQIVHDRLNLYGEEFGMTVFPDKGGELNREELDNYHYDNWTIMSYVKALINYNLPEAFKRTFAGHILFHMCPDIYVAYEQVSRSGEPRTAWADYCIPSQLALPMMYLLAKESGIMDVDSFVNEIIKTNR